MAAARKKKSASRRSFVTDYVSPGFHDELVGGRRARPMARELLGYLNGLGIAGIGALQEAAELTIKEMGITFTVYLENEGSIDRSWPLDIVPRLLQLDEWRRIEAGLTQRVQALNLLIDDLYHEQKVVKDKVLPAAVLAQSKNFRKQCIGIDPPLGVWAHICGSDLVRGADGTVYVLEDNLRVPSGVSYMLENRAVIKRIMPDVFDRSGVLPVDGYPEQLFDMLAALSPRPGERPFVVVLTPGIYNSAYFEHSYLAQQMGCELVEGTDLVVGDDDCVYARTVEGLQRVDVIYRRIDDEFMDPEAYRKDSMLGVAGLMRARSKGNVALANAPGAGVADDKVVYAYVPRIIRYYLDEEPILPNVPTHICSEDEARAFVVDNLEELVVKPANESGGYGMLMGPQSTKRQRAEFRRLIKSDPRNYIAQPVLAISTTPTFTGEGIEPRHVDLRPFVLSGDRVSVTTGGLTRVAMRKGSLIVNSSQGGGSKDTWVVDASVGAARGARR